MSNAEIATKFVNDWLEDTSSLPVTPQLARLGLGIAHLLDCADNDDDLLYPRREQDEEEANDAQAWADFAASEQDRYDAESEL